MWVVGVRVKGTCKKSGHKDVGVDVCLHKGEAEVPASVGQRLWHTHAQEHLPVVREGHCCYGVRQSCA